MTILRKLLLATLLFCTLHSFAQTILPVPVNLQRTYTKGTRTINGAPGKNYWQNWADYNIKVNFDPQTRVIKGTVDIDYTNNSLDTLINIYFKLYPNLYAKNTIRNSVVRPEDMTDGVQIQSLIMNEQKQEASQWRINGTNMTVNIPAILPSQKAHFTISYSYVLNKGSHIRTGQVDSGAFFIAYFFPRIAVYDDIDGWNKYPYRGSEEFYNDFCHFNAEVTVPGNYQVWATGNLKNTAEVYTPRIAERVAAAGRNDAITDVITTDDFKAGNITTPGKTHTWKFEADSVTDFAFATSNHYVWKASSLVVDSKTGRRTRVDAVYNTAHKDYLPVVEHARKTVEVMSYQFPKWPYPYPHETVFDGLDQMEYPMMVNDNPTPTVTDEITLTDHEIFHTMFPFYMGINETKYAWMDEGWATIGEWIVSTAIDPKIDDNYGMDAYNHSAGTEEDMPIMSLTPSLIGVSTFTDSYPKPAMGYLYVKDMLGDELFTKALHHYINQWHGKHPMPYDFFNCINTGSGINLNWFWKAWFFDSGVPDLGITQVAKQQNNYTVTITRIGGKPVPVHLRVNYADGSNELLHQSIAAWQNGQKTCILKFTSAKPVTKLVLGTTYDADANKKDNVYVMK
ncbi:M1 family metallopeptidase [Mucilaginibacter lacusdianchii]|uniref:M1 family metallopeptidase n=1 Tax=Mucilaginibacter lacusdianchii TaxID=2684211 RepID=UPI00131C6118|nr:M1 family metallopeptidase [Mucilaginibacter sp. JXJ CY 39]